MPSETLILYYSFSSCLFLFTLTYSLHLSAHLKTCMHWTPLERVHGVLGALIWDGSRDNQCLGGGGKDCGAEGGATLILAQVGWRWLRSALPFKEGKLMFFLAKHNIVREVHNRSLSPVFPCISAWVCAFTVCVCVRALLWRLHLTFHEREGTSSWSFFKVRPEFLKDTLSVNFTVLFKQRISLLTFSPAPPSPCQLQKPRASSSHNDWGPWKERKGQKKEKQHV